MIIYYYYCSVCGSSGSLIAPPYSNTFYNHPNFEKFFHFQMLNSNDMKARLKISKLNERIKFRFWSSHCMFAPDPKSTIRLFLSIFIVHWKQIFLRQWYVSRIWRSTDVSVEKPIPIAPCTVYVNLQRIIISTVFVHFLDSTKIRTFHKHMFSVSGKG